MAPKVIYQTAGVSDISDTKFTRFSSNVRISNGLTDDIIFFKNGNIDQPETIILKF